MLCVVLALALAVRIHAAYQSPIIARDGTIFLVMAHQMSQVGVNQAIHQFQYHPGFPAIIAGVAKLTGPGWPDGWVLVGRWVAIVASLVVLAMLYIYASKMFDPGVALVTVLLLGLSEGFTIVSADTLSDAPAAAFAMCGFVMTLKARESLVRASRSAALWSALVGLAAGAGYLCRPEALLPAVLCVIILIWKRGLTPRGRAIQLVSLVALAVCTLACVLPYALAIGGLTQKKSFADFALSASGLPCLANITFPPDMLDAMRRVLDRGRAIIGTPLAVLAGVCWVTWIGRYIFRIKPPDRVVIKPAPVPLAMMAIALVIFFVMLTGLETNHPRYISARHMLLPALLLVPCAGAGLFTLIQWTIWLVERYAGGENPRGLAAFLSAHKHWAVYLWLAIVLAAIGVNALRLPQEGKSCYRQIGLEILHRAGPGHRILAADNWPAFYAQSPADQFMPSAGHLEPQDLASPETVYRKSVQTGYEYAAIYNHGIETGNNYELADQAMHDPRFKFITKRQSKDQIAWLFLVVPATPAP